MELCFVITCDRYMGQQTKFMLLSLNVAAVSNWNINTFPKGRSIQKYCCFGCLVTRRYGTGINFEQCFVITCDKFMGQQTKLMLLSLNVAAESNGNNNAFSVGRRF